MERLRYVETLDPVRSDGRDLDAGIAELSGEAADQRAVAAPTYYGVRMLKPPVWSLDIPLYYFVGGAAGAALTLGAAIQLVSHERDLRRLSKQCHWIGIAGSTLGAALLIHDLGRPSRFLCMVRVFRPTSPMSVGAWVLGVTAPTAIATGLFLNRPGTLGKIGEAAGYASGIFGAALAGYTGVLVGNTVIPVWYEPRGWLPILFVSSAAATAASVLDLFFARGPAARVTAIFGTAGRVAELGSGYAMERCWASAAGRPERAGRGQDWPPYGGLWTAAKILTAASLVVSLVPGQSTRVRRVAGVLGALGSLCLRLAVHRMGETPDAVGQNVHSSQQSHATTNYPD
jgi:hypothetical protein